LRIKEQETCLTLQEYDDDDDDILSEKVIIFSSMLIIEQELIIIDYDDKTNFLEVLYWGTNFSLVSI